MNKEVIIPFDEHLTGLLQTKKAFSGAKMNIKVINAKQKKISISIEAPTEKIFKSHFMGIQQTLTIFEKIRKIQHGSPGTN
ncbi:hypothetical protein J4457_04180 [Candidatus Woesearchaeota archaeon]|nr:hypothetical protein [Candidatus Woesearchaeota archaeon]